VVKGGKRVAMKPSETLYPSCTFSQLKQQENRCVSCEKVQHTQLFTAYQHSCGYLEVGAVGAGQVRRAAHHLGQRVHQRVQHLFAGVAQCGT
jgi:hypothetical protein